MVTQPIASGRWISAAAVCSSCRCQDAARTPSPRGSLKPGGFCFERYGCHGKIMGKPQALWDNA